MWAIPFYVYETWKNTSPITWEEFFHKIYIKYNLLIIVLCNVMETRPSGFYWDIYQNIEGPSLEMVRMWGPFFSTNIHQHWQFHSLRCFLCNICFHHLSHRTLLLSVFIHTTSQNAKQFLKITLKISNKFRIINV